MWKKLDPIDISEFDIDEDLQFVKKEGFDEGVGKYIEQGLCDDDGIKNGFGRSFTRLEIYEGEFARGKREGWGRAVKVDLTSWTP